MIITAAPTRIRKSQPTNPWRGLALYCWWRYRYSFMALAVYLMVSGSLLRIVHVNAVERLVLLGTFLFGSLSLLPAILGGNSDLIGTESAFPRFLFTIPVRTTTLVSVFMSSAMVSLTLICVSASKLLLAPLGITVPTGLIVLALCTSGAWTQMLAWMPIPFRYGRAIITMIALAAVIGFEVAGCWHLISPAIDVAVSAGVVALAHLVAVKSVARVRRGDTWKPPAGHSGTTESHVASDSAQQSAVALSHRLRMQNSRHEGAQTRLAKSHSPKRFASAELAQLWFEWRQVGPLTAIVIALPFVLTLPIAAFHKMVPLGGLPGFTQGILGIQVNLWSLVTCCLALTAPAMLGMPYDIWQSPNLGTSWRGEMRRNPFVATRPMTSAGYVTSRLKAALLRVMLGWAVIAVAVAVALILPAQDGLRAGPLGGLLMHYLTRRTAASAIVAALMIVWITLKRQADSQFTLLIGESWFVMAYSLIAGAGFTLFTPQVIILANFEVPRQLFEHIWKLLPTAVLFAAVSKLIIGAIVVRLLIARRIVAARSIVRLCGWWALAYAVLLGLVRFAVPVAYASFFTLACGVVLLMPMVRVGLAPLAWEWNRRR